MELSDEGLAVFRQSRTMNDGIMALIQNGIRDAAPLCASIKRAQQFTDKGLTPASAPDTVQTSTTKKELK